MHHLITRLLKSTGKSCSTNIKKRHFSEKRLGDPKKLLAVKTIRSEEEPAVIKTSKDSKIIVRS